MQNVTPSAVQLRYTGALVRSDGRTQPLPLDDIERLYGEYVLDEVMSSAGRGVDVAVPDDAVVAAAVNERAYTVRVVPTYTVTSDFLVDADAGTITLPINAPLFSLVQALHTARQHEPTVRTRPAAPQRYRCWSTRGGEVAVVILPRAGKREIPMEKAAADPELRRIFNRVREAEQAAWSGGPHASRPKAYVDLNDAEIETLNDQQMPRPRRD